MIQQGLFVNGLSRRQGHECVADFTKNRVSDTDDTGKIDRRMSFKHLFDFLGIDVIAA